MNRTEIKQAARSVAGYVRMTSIQTDMSRTGQSMMRLLILHHAKFCGSASNAASLVIGLSTGCPVTLSSQDEKVTFLPSTQGIDLEEAHRTIELARIGLHARGIDHPTPIDLQAALEGVLNGMAWMDSLPHPRNAAQGQNDH